jgi:hypothetical protein
MQQLVSSLSSDSLCHDRSHLSVVHMTLVDMVLLSPVATVAANSGSPATCTKRMVALNLESFLSLNHLNILDTFMLSCYYLALSNFKPGTSDSPKVVNI